MDGAAVGFFFQSDPRFCGGVLVNFEGDTRVTKGIIPWL